MGELEGGIDWEEPFAGLDEDWEVIGRVLPDGWEEAARPTRGFKDAPTPLRVPLIHLAGGYSLREAAVRTDAGGQPKVSDVALLGRLLGRLLGSSEWFRWMVEQTSRRRSATDQDVLPGKQVRLVEASVVCEPWGHRVGLAAALHARPEHAGLQTTAGCVARRGRNADPLCRASQRPLDGRSRAGAPARHTPRRQSPRR